MDLLLATYVFVVGIVIGSFLNVVIYRYQAPIKVSQGRSMCSNCHTTLKAIDLIPVFSYLFLKGKCRYCHQHISLRYPIVELLTGFVFLAIYLKFKITIQTPIYCIIAAFLISAAFIDLDSMIIPDRTHIALIIAGILLIPFDHLIKDRIIGLLIISIPFFIIAYITKGLGYGDVKLMASAGFLLGYKLIIVAALLGIILGGIIGAISLLKGSDKKSEMPLGPSLIIAIFLALFYGQPLITWYLSLLI